MDEQEREDYHFRCICGTSVEYARYYVQRASLATLQRCLEDRRVGKTLRRMIEARIRRLEREEIASSLRSSQ